MSTAPTWAPPEPTGDQCQNREPVTWVHPNHGERHGFACWYPQMSGYVGKCVVEFLGDEPDGCFDAWVWHDGEFPFSDSRQKPRALHHCAAAQFIRFGNEVAERQLARANRKGADQQS
jgi:hypothetical protein